MPSPEQVSNFNEQRTLSDAEKIKGGAKYKGAELKVTDEQFDDVKGEMNLELQAKERIKELTVDLNNAMAIKDYASITKISTNLATLQEMVDNHNFSDIIKEMAREKGRYASPRPEARGASGKNNGSSEGSRPGYSSN